MSIYFVFTLRSLIIVLLLATADPIVLIHPELEHFTSLIRISSFCTKTATKLQHHKTISFCADNYEFSDKVSKVETKLIQTSSLAHQEEDHLDRTFRNKICDEKPEMIQ